MRNPNWKTSNFCNWLYPVLYRTSKESFWKYYFIHIIFIPKFQFFSLRWDSASFPHSPVTAVTSHSLSPRLHPPLLGSLVLASGSVRCCTSVYRSSFPHPEYSSSIATLWLSWSFLTLSKIAVVTALTNDTCHTPNLQSRCYLLEPHMKKVTMWIDGYISLITVMFSQRTHRSDHAALLK